MEEKALVIIGATASGKSEVAFELAKILKSEIISADSRQFYRELNIGTAKPHEHWLKSVKHHFIDNLSISDDYNVYQFRTEAMNIVNSLHRKNIIPVIVGGSGLYIRALVKGIIEHDAVDEKIKNELLAKKKEFGSEFLYEELKKVDARSAETMLPQNWKRVIRALEVFYQTGKPIWMHFEEQESKSKIKFIQFGLNWERKQLYERINNRVDEMIATGLVDEVRYLMKKYPVFELNSLNTVGYKEIFQYLKNEIDLTEAIRLIKRNTRHYAKRQITWFKKDEFVNWIDCNEKFSAKVIAKQIASDLS